MLYCEKCGEEFTDEWKIEYKADIIWYKCPNCDVYNVHP